MKKALFLCVASVFASATIASAANVDITAKVTTFKPSANVLVSYGVTATTGQDYVVNAKHLSGDRIYSSSNKTSGLYFKAGTAGVALVIASDGDTTPGQTTYGTGWSSQ